MTDFRQSVWGPRCRVIDGNIVFSTGSTHFLCDANATSMLSIRLIFAHLGKSKMQNGWEIIDKIAHCAVAVEELFWGASGGPLRRPVEGPFVNCRVFAVTCALFAERDVLGLWPGAGRRRIFTYRKSEISTPAGVKQAVSRAWGSPFHLFPHFSNRNAIFWSQDFFSKARRLTSGEG